MTALTYSDMTFTPVNELERLLVAASTDESARPAFLRGLLERDLFLIKQGDPPEQKEIHVAGQDTMVELALIEIKGKTFVPIFTSVDRITAIVPQDVAYVTAKGEHVLTMLREQEVVLNPGADYGKFFTPKEINALLSGSAFAKEEPPQPAPKKAEPKPAETRVEPPQANPKTQTGLSQPKELPKHVVEPLARWFASQPKVNAAYLVQISAAGGEPPHTVIGLDVTGDWTDIARETGSIAREAAKAGEKVDVIRVWPEDRNEAIADFMLRETTPFYKGRKKWLGLF